MDTLPRRRAPERAATHIGLTISSRPLSATKLPFYPARSTRASDRKINTGKRGRPDPESVRSDLGSADQPVPAF